MGRTEMYMYEDKNLTDCLLRIIHLFACFNVAGQVLVLINATVYPERNTHREYAIFKQYIIKITKIISKSDSLVLNQCTPFDTSRFGN